jgi:hypothetical protein
MATETEKTEIPLQEKTASNVDDGNNELGAAVELAHTATETKYSPFTASMWRLYGVLWVGYLCGCLNGYDGSLMGGLNAVDQYQEYFQV